MANDSIKWVTLSSTKKQVAINYPTTVTSFDTNYNFLVNGSAFISGALSANSISLSSPLLVSQGGTGVSSLSSGYALIGNGTDAITFREIVNNTTASDLGWDSKANATRLITQNTLAYWNGAYNSNGKSNITTVSTITSGIWNGSIIGLSYGGTGASDAAGARAALGIGSSSGAFPITVAQGGTGSTTFTANAILAGNTTSALKTIATAKGALYATAANGAASFGTLPVGEGGTGATTFTANAILAGNTTSALKTIATASGALYATAANGAASFGTLPIAQGGTGATSSADARTNLGLGSVAINGTAFTLATTAQSTASSFSNSYGQYSMYVVMGYLSSNQGRSSIAIPKTAVLASSAVSSTNHTDFTISDETNYNRFSLYYSGTTLYIKARGGSAALNSSYIYGII